MGLLNIFFSCHDIYSTVCQHFLYHSCPSVVDRSHPGRPGHPESWQQYCLSTAHGTVHWENLPTERTAAPKTEVHTTSNTNGEITNQSPYATSISNTFYQCYTKHFSHFLQELRYQMGSFNKPFSLFSYHSDMGRSDTSSELASKQQEKVATRWGIGMESIVRAVWGFLQVERPLGQRLQQDSNTQ